MTYEVPILCIIVSHEVAEVKFAETREEENRQQEVWRTTSIIKYAGQRELPQDLEDQEEISAK